MDTRLLNRISKLLALGNGSSFDGEAETALCNEKVKAIKTSESPTDAWGIVPVEEVTQWLKTRRPELVNATLRSSYRDAVAYADGKKDGETINLNRQFAQQSLPCA